MIIIIITIIIIQTLYTTINFDNNNSYKAVKQSRGVLSKMKRSRTEKLQFVINTSYSGR